MDDIPAGDFFQFDIRVFRKPAGDFNGLLRTIFASSIRSLADSFRQVAISPTQKEDQWHAIERRAIRFFDSNADEDFDMETAAAIDFLDDASWLNDSDYLKPWTGEELNRELASIDATPGHSRFARVRKDILQDYCYRQKEQEFRVLAAIYSQFGGEGFRQITRRQIRLAASGFASEADFANHGAETHLLTEDQVRWATDKLESRGLFCSVIYGSRRRYFSHSMSQRELASKVTSLHQRRAIRKPLKIPPVAKETRGPTPNTTP